MAFIPTGETLALIAGIGGWAGVWHATSIYLDDEPVNVQRVVKMAALPVIWATGCVGGHIAGYCVVRTCSLIFTSMFQPVPFIINILALSGFAIALTAFVGIRKRFRSAAETFAEELAADAAADDEESDDDSSETTESEDDDDAEDDDSQTEEDAELDQLSSSATQPAAELPAPVTLPASPFEQGDTEAVEPVVEAVVEADVEAVAEPVVEAVVEAVAEPAVEAAVEAFAEPVVEAAVEPVAEPVVEQVTV